ncbi:MAG: hypothetical protein Q9194_006278 [Teloschistes cf. exilis]
MALQIPPSLSNALTPSIFFLQASARSFRSPSSPSFALRLLSSTAGLSRTTSPYITPPPLPVAHPTCLIIPTSSLLLFKTALSRLQTLAISSLLAQPHQPSLNPLPRLCAFLYARSNPDCDLLASNILSRMLQQVNTQPGGPPYNGVNLQQHIARLLSQRPTPQGWQMSVPVAQRVHIIVQLFTFLRLLQKNNEHNKTLDFASGFEKRTFEGSPDKNTYEQSCKQKMNELQDWRAKNSAGMQQQINARMGMPQHMQTMTQNLIPQQSQGMSQQGFQNAQMQQMMQHPGLHLQQQPQPPGHQLHNMPMAHPQVPPSEQLGRPVNTFTPTPEENQVINRLATQMYQTMPGPRLQMIQAHLQQQMHPSQRESLARQGIDLLQMYFRNQAVKKFVENRRAQAGTLGGSNVQAPGMVNAMHRPISQNAGRPQGQQGSVPPQGFEPPFDQIFGQQQDGLRSQEAGQIVVPASDPQANLDQRNGPRVNVQHQVNVPNGASRPLPNGNPNQSQSQAYWNTQRNVNQAAGINGNTPNLGNVGQASSNVLQGQPGGLDNQITRTPSQTPDMPNLNKAAGPPGQTPNMWQQKTPQPNHAKPQGNSMAQQAVQQQMDRPNASQQQPASYRQMPVQLRQQLLSMPEEQRRGFLTEFQQNMRKQHQQQMDQQQLHQQTQQQANMVNARAGMTDGFPMSSQTSQPGMQARPIGPIPNQNLPMHQAMMQNSNGPQPSGHQQNPAYHGGVRQQAVPGQKLPQQRAVSQVPDNAANAPPLTEEQIRHMDQRLFPGNILNRQSEILPPDVKTWGQLKEFAAKNPSNMPTGALKGFQELQALHFRQQQEPRSSQPGTNPAAMPQQQAPFAQMVSQPNTQASIPATRPPNVISVPQPSQQEVQNARTRLPPQCQAMSDIEIRNLLIRQRQFNLMKSLQAHQAQNPHMPNGLGQTQQVAQPQNQGLIGRSEATQPPRIGYPKASVPQAQQAPEATANQTSKQWQQNRTATMNKQPPKGVKRSSQEDVVEVPNPNRATPQVQGQTSHPAQTAKQLPTQASKARSEIKGSASENAAPADQIDGADTQVIRPPAMLSIPKEEIERRDTRLKQLMHEVGQGAPVRNIVPMTAEIKAQMTLKLRELGPMVARMEMSFPAFFRNNPDENVTRQLIQTRNVIKAQYLDASFNVKEFNVKEKLTITPDDLNSAYTSIRQYFAFVMSKFGRPRPNAPQVGEQHWQKPAVNQGKAPLSAENLKEQQNALQAQRAAAAMQRHHSGHGSRVPAAPTTDKPPNPFPLGPQSPHGTPVYEGPASCTVDKLILPQPKRMKSNHNQPSAGSTPVLVPDTTVAKSSPLGPKMASPEARRASVPQMSFKCSLSDCQSGQKGFATQAELEQHNTDAHAPEEPMIQDPAEFALESMRLALGLDEHGRSKVQKEDAEAPAMKVSLSASSNAAIKQEASTPMSRGGTQTGLSPSWQLLKTPQSSSNVRNAMADGKVVGMKGNATPGKEVTPTPSDAWAGSSISPDEITSAWSSLADMQSLSFTKYQMSLTPSSTLSSSNEKNSPRLSDISENDVVKIGVDVGKEDKDSWIPSEWFDDVYGDLESLSMGQDSLMEDMGWEPSVDEADAEMADVNTTSRNRKIAAEIGTSEEWLKVYAPEKLTPRKGR